MHARLFGKEELSGYGVRCFAGKKRIFCFFLFSSPFLAVFGRGLVIFHVFWCLFCDFIVILGTNASCGTKEALFFEYFWLSLFLRRLLAECFLFFSLMHDIPSSKGGHTYMGDVGCGMLGPYVMACIRAICDHIADRGAMEVTKRK